ncbi:MAG: hypothetical protein ACYS76_13600 [Planctomycetota bacterium]
MKTALRIIAPLILGFLAGCNGTVEVQEVPQKPLPEGNELFTVDFNEGQTLRYKFVSSREATLDWGAADTKSKSGKTGVDKSSESMEMVVAYTPVEVNPYGLTVINAACESVRVKRTSRRGGSSSKDPVNALAGKTFTFTVRPTGKIDDYSQLEKLIKELGEKAFRPGGRRDKLGRIKEPDMIADFMATQWFLWDSVSSIEKPTEGVSVGQTWKSKLSIPAPMVMWKARDVTYEFAEVRHTEKGRVAVIKSTYSPAESASRSWPIPYSGNFQVSGRFGLLRGFRVQNLQGSGEELFNLDAGRIEQCSQQYKVQVAAFLLFPLPGANPRISIRQKLTMKLLEN